MIKKEALYETSIDEQVVWDYKIADDEIVIYSERGEFDVPFQIAEDVLMLEQPQTFKYGAVTALQNAVDELFEEYDLSSVEAPQYVDYVLSSKEVLYDALLFSQSMDLHKLPQSIQLEAMLKLALYPYSVGMTHEGEGYFAGDIALEGSDAVLNFEITDGVLRIEFMGTEGKGHERLPAGEGDVSALLSFVPALEELTEKYEVKSLETETWVFDEHPKLAGRISRRLGIPIQWVTFKGRSFRASPDGTVDRLDPMEMFLETILESDASEEMKEVLLQAIQGKTPAELLELPEEVLAGALEQTIYHMLVEWAQQWTSKAVSQEPLETSTVQEEPALSSSVPSVLYEAIPQDASAVIPTEALAAAFDMLPEETLAALTTEIAPAVYAGILEQWPGDTILDVEAYELAEMLMILVTEQEAASMEEVVQEVPTELAVAAALLKKKIAALLKVALYSYSIRIEFDTVGYVQGQITLEGSDAVLDFEIIDNIFHVEFMGTAGTGHQRLPPGEGDVSAYLSFMPAIEELTKRYDVVSMEGETWIFDEHPRLAERMSRRLGIPLRWTSYEGGTFYANPEGEVGRIDPMAIFIENIGTSSASDELKEALLLAVQGKTPAELLGMSDAEVAESSESLIYDMLAAWAQEWARAYTSQAMLKVGESFWPRLKQKYIWTSNYMLKHPVGMPKGSPSI